MSHTPGQFMADSGITRDEVEAEKRRMLDEIRLYELKEARKAGISPQNLESGDADHIKVDRPHVADSPPGGRELRLV